MHLSCLLCSVRNHTAADPVGNGILYQRLRQSAFRCNGGVKRPDIVKQRRFCTDGDQNMQIGGIRRKIVGIDRARKDDDARSVLQIQLHVSFNCSLLLISYIRRISESPMWTFSTMMP